MTADSAEEGSWDGKTERRRTLDEIVRQAYVPTVHSADELSAEEIDYAQEQFLLRDMPLSLIATFNKVCAQAKRAEQAGGAVAARDVLLVNAILATQDGSSGRMVCDVEKLLSHYNEGKRASPIGAGELETIERDAAIGRLVRQKMISGNSVSVERCTITADEISALSATGDTPK